MNLGGIYKDLGNPSGSCLYTRLELKLVTPHLINLGGIHKDLNVDPALASTSNPRTQADNPNLHEPGRHLKTSATLISSCLHSQVPRLKPNPDALEPGQHL